MYSGQKVLNEYGKCQCGCGMETEKVKVNNKKLGLVKGTPNKYIRNHQNKGKSGPLSRSWKGGSYTNSAGYKMIMVPGHARAGSNGYVREHIVIAENALCGPLPDGAQVHHVNGAGDNSQLVICEDQEYHFLLHIRADALEKSGDASKRRCKFCGKYDTLANIYCKKIKGKSGGWNTYHMDCARKYDRERYARREAK